MPGLVLGTRGRPEHSEGYSGVDEARLCRALSWVREEGLSAANERGAGLFGLRPLERGPGQPWSAYCEQMREGSPGDRQRRWWLICLP